MRSIHVRMADRVGPLRVFAVIGEAEKIDEVEVWGSRRGKQDVCRLGTMVDKVSTNSSS